MKNSVIGILYSGGTRPARVLNFVISSVWVLVLMFHSFKIVPVVLPQGILQESLLLLCLALSSALSSLASLLCSKYRQLHKCLSLHTGALLQALVSAGYAMDYPPLAMTSITSALFAIWLLGAAYFVMSDKA